MPRTVIATREARWIFWSLCLAGFLGTVVVLGAGGGDGFSSYKAGRYGEALEAFRAAAADDPGSAVAAANVGAALARLSRHEEAARVFVAALELDPDPRVEAAIRFDLGNEQMAMGQFQDAVASYTESLRLNPGDVQAKMNLEIALRRMPRTPPPQGGGDESSGGGGAPGGGGSSQATPEERGRAAFDKAEAERLLDAIGRRERLEFPRRARTAPTDPGVPDW